MGGVEAGYHTMESIGRILKESQRKNISRTLYERCMVKVGNKHIFTIFVLRLSRIPNLRLIPPSPNRLRRSRAGGPVGDGLTI